VIIVDGNPLENISNIRKVRTVIANGRMYDCAGLWQSVGFKPWEQPREPEVCIDMRPLELQSLQRLNNFRHFQPKQ
jgi:hypothetical protein